MNNSYVANCKPWAKRHCVTSIAVVHYDNLCKVDRMAVLAVDIAINKMMKHAK